MHCINDISYAPDNGFRGSGDLFLPDEPSGKPAALVIHGGVHYSHFNHEIFYLKISKIYFVYIFSIVIFKSDILSILNTVPPEPVSRSTLSIDNDFPS